MPQVIPAVVAWAASTAFTVAGVAVTYGTLVEAAVIAGSIAYSSAENRRIRNQLDSLNADRGRDLMTRDPLAYRRLIYGQVRTTGPILYMATEGAKNENLHLVVALASHECDDLGEITIDNDELVPLDGSGNATGRLAGYFTVKKFLGTTTQSASAELQAAFPGVWTTNHNLFGIAYLHVKMKYNVDLYPNGMPTIKCLVRGKKLWDPRVNPTDTTIRAWSCNSTLCTADYLNDADFGRGIAWTRINQAAMIEGANVCEEAIGLAGNFTRQMDTFSGSKNINMTTQASAQLDGMVVGMRVSGTGIPAGARITYIDDVGPVFYFSIDVNCTSTGTNRTGTFGATEYRYETHGTVTTDQTVDSVTLDLAGSMAGHVTDMGGIWTIRAGAYRTPTVDLDESHMIGPITMTPRVSRRDNYNGVKGTYISPFNQWVASDAPAVKNDTYMAWDGGIRLWKDVTLPFTISPSAAQRLFKIDLERGRQQIQVEQTFKLHAFECMCFDTVRITKTELGWSNKEFEVTNWKFTVIMNGGEVALGVTLSLRETAAAVWSWSDGSETTVDLAANTNLPNPSTVPTPTGLALLTDSTTSFFQGDGTFIPRLKLTWNLPNNQYVEQDGLTICEYKKSADSIWLEGAKVRGDKTLAYITDVKVGTTYDVRISHVNSLGVHSNNNGTPTFNTITSYTIAGDNSGPSTPSGLAFVTGTGKSVSLSWNANTEVDLDYYTIKRSTDNITFTTVGRVSANRFVDVNVTIGTAYYYKVSATDDSQNPSTDTASVGPATPGTIAGGSVDTTPPSNPSAPTISSSGTRISGDGTTVAYFVIGMSSMPSGAVGMNLLYRKSGAAEWIIGNQTDASGGTCNIDDLTPGTTYDIGIQAFSVFGYCSSIITLASQSAPNNANAPATPTGLTCDGKVTPKKIDASNYYFGLHISWQANTELDLDHYEVKVTSVDSDGSSSASFITQDGSDWPTKTKDLSIDVYHNTLPAAYVRVRAVNRTGNPSPWANLSGVSQTSNANTGLNFGTASGTIAQGNDSRITGAAQKSNNLSDLASATTSRQNIGVRDHSVVISPSGGSPTEGVTINHNIGTQQFRVLAAVVDPPLYNDIVHDFASGSNDANNTRLLLVGRNGGNVNGGGQRVTIHYLP